MSAAVQRFAQLKVRFRKLVPDRRLSREQWREIAWAASLQQVVEITVAEMVLGAAHDQQMVETMQSGVRARIAAASVKSKTRKGKE